MAIEDFNHIKDVVTKLNSERPSRFGYTEAAVNAVGAAEITALEGNYIIGDPTQVNSIPTPDLVGVDPTLINIGLRAQASTIPRMAVNHFLGRLGLNLLKLTEKVKLLVNDHLVNRYITPSGEVMEDVTVGYSADEITLIKHRSPLSASAPVTASAAVSLLAAVYNGNAGVMTGADKKALDDAVTDLTGVVKLSGDQTIADVKTFSSIPILPAVDPTDDNHAARRAFVLAQLSNRPGAEQRLNMGVYTEKSTGVNSDINLGRLTIAPGIIEVGSSILSRTTPLVVEILNDLTPSRWYIIYINNAGIISLEMTSASSYTTYPQTELDTEAPVNATRSARYKSGDPSMRALALAFTCPAPNAWVGGTPYVRGQMITYAVDGNNYICIQAHTPAQTPGSAPTYWQLMGDKDRVFMPKVFNFPESTFGTGALGDVDLVFGGTGLGDSATPFYGLRENVTGTVEEYPEYEFNNLTIGRTVYCGKSDGLSLDPVVIRVKGTLTIGAAGQLNGDSRGANGGAGGVGTGSAKGTGGAGAKSGRPIHVYANKIIDLRVSGYWLTTQAGDGNNSNTVVGISLPGGGGASSSGIKIVSNSDFSKFYNFNNVIQGKAGRGASSVAGISSGNGGLYIGNANISVGGGELGGGGVGGSTNSGGGSFGAGGGGSGNVTAQNGSSPTISHIAKLGYIIIIDKYNSREAI